MSHPNDVCIFVEQPVEQVPTIEKKSKIGTIRFTAILQTCNVPNANRRIYPRPLMEQVINARQEDMANSKLLGELDHPVEAAFEQDLLRIASVYLKNASHKILECWFEGNTIWGRLETLYGTEAGRTLSGLIEYDKTPIGFSLRALGNKQQIVNQNLILVMPPLTFITYDAVSKPSNAKAWMQKIEFKKFLESAIHIPSNDYPQEVTTPSCACNQDFDTTASQVFIESINDPFSSQHSKKHIVCFGDRCFLLEHLDQMIDKELRALIESYL